MERECLAAQSSSPWAERDAKGSFLHLNVRERLAANHQDTAGGGDRPCTRCTGREFSFNRNTSEGPVQPLRDCRCFHAQVPACARAAAARRRAAADRRGAAGRPIPRKAGTRLKRGRVFARAKKGRIDLGLFCFLQQWVTLCIKTWPQTMKRSDQALLSQYERGVQMAQQPNTRAMYASAFDSSANWQEWIRKKMDEEQACLS